MRTLNLVDSYSAVGKQWLRRRQRQRQRGSSTLASCVSYWNFIHRCVLCAALCSIRFDLISLVYPIFATHFCHFSKWLESWSSARGGLHKEALTELDDKRGLGKTLLLYWLHFPSSPASKCQGCAKAKRELNQPPAAHCAPKVVCLLAFSVICLLRYLLCFLLLIAFVIV